MNEETLKAFQVLIGRVDALHAGLCVIARTLPAPIAQEAAQQIRLGAELAQADGLGHTASDIQLDETNRVLMQLASLLESVAQNPR